MQRGSADTVLAQRAATTYVGATALFQFINKIVTDLC